MQATLNDISSKRHFKIIWNADTDNLLKLQHKQPWQIREPEHRLTN